MKLSNPSEHDQPTALREAFLDRLSRELRSGCTPLETFETIAEVRAHLLASSAAYEELGLAPIEAMNAAIDSFGDAKTIGRKVIRETAGPASASTRFIACVGTGAVACTVLMLGADASLVLTHTVANPSPGMGGIGTFVGALLGLTLFLRPRPVVSAVLRAGLFMPTAFLVAVCWLNRTIPWTSFLAVSFVAIGIATGGTAALVAFVQAKMTGRGHPNVPA